MYKWKKKQQQISIFGLLIKVIEYIRKGVEFECLLAQIKEDFVPLVFVTKEIIKKHVMLK